MKRSQNTLDSFIVVKKQKEKENEIGDESIVSVEYIDDIINNQPSTSTKTSVCGNQLLVISREIGIEEDELYISENNMDAGKSLDHDMIPDLQKMNILKYAMVPDKNFVYPFSLHKKKNKDVKCYLSEKHFQMFEWLTFSVSKKGVFCKYCLLFAKYGGQHKQTLLNKLVKTPLCKYSKLLGKDGDLASHQERRFHKESVIHARNFTKNYCDEKNKVINMLDTNRREQIVENRKRLTPIIESIIFLGRQNIPLRGHRDNGDIRIESSETGNANEGNFRELLRFRVASGDNILKEHLKNSSSRATYISAKTQNELIEYCKEEILTIILERIRECKYYCIIFDETTDISHISQMSVILRYVSKNQIFEDFVGFINCHASNYNEPSIEPVMTGKILAQTVVKLLKTLNLNVNHCVGIGTDGCNLMLGEQKGAVKELQQELKNAVKCPCSNHALNLSISKSSNVQSIRNATGIMKEVITFFNSSSKRHSILLHVNGKKLQKLCDTRWIERHESVQRFKECFSNIIESLNLISNWGERDSASKAACLKLSLISTNFIVSLCCLSEVLGLTVNLSKILQTKTIDNLYAEKIITNVLLTLQLRREKGDDNFNKIYKEIAKIHEMLEIDITMPRVVGKQTMRPNIQCNSPEDYYRITVYFPVLDSIIEDFRFNNKAVFYFSNVVPSICLEHLHAQLENCKNNLVAFLFQLIESESETSLYRRLTSELELWINEWKNCHEMPDTGFDSLLKCDKNIYPLIYFILQIQVTLPISVASAERSFSSLRRLKTYIRSTMSENGLTGLALLNIHRDIQININNIIDRFSSKKIEN